MKAFNKLLSLYEKYRTSIDSYFYCPDISGKQVDDMFELIGELRVTIEALLPELVFLANSLSDSDFEEMYKGNQKLYIDDFNYRAEIFKLIAKPSPSQTALFKAFYESAEFS